ncbi:hypothetical protein [Massilia alkalitolerans]|uniref:hypothetical protein n=1 Tax=Massilia alkalitolerans TaxID=286638 RepID=UPI0028AE64F1|nr:hypothetical protein [Massilia alkalitolerans]
MNLETFFVEARRRNIVVPSVSTKSERSIRLDNEALFQLPLLSMVILVISKGRGKPSVSEIGQLVGECLERTVSGFKGTSQDIGWSANLRIRTIRALSFLERSKLATVDQSKNVIVASELGRKVVEFACDEDTPLAFALKTIERSYQNIRVERGIMEEVE